MEFRLLACTLDFVEPRFRLSGLDYAEIYVDVMSIDAKLAHQLTMKESGKEAYFMLHFSL